MKAPTRTQRVRSRRLRREQTDAEARLWSHLRARQLAGVKFRRQMPIGPFVMDFCCMEMGLVVEVDGGQHAERESEDVSRSKQLEAEGFRILRFWNHEVLQNTSAVLERISNVIEQLREEGRCYGESRERRGNC